MVLGRQPPWSAGGFDAVLIRACQSRLGQRALWAPAVTASGRFPVL